MQPHQYYVYIVTNCQKTVLYTGVTNDLIRRILEHWENSGKNQSFTSRYHAYYLLHFESFNNINDAIAREKEIKCWRREKKMQLINQTNPNLKFLNKELFGSWPPFNMDNPLKTKNHIPPSSE